MEDESLWYSQRTAASRGLNLGFAALQTREHKPGRKPSALWIHRTSRKEGYVLGVGFVAHGGMGVGVDSFRALLTSTSLCPYVQKTYLI